MRRLYLNCVEVWVNSEQQWSARLNWGTVQDDGKVPSAVEGTINTTYFHPSLDEAIDTVLNAAQEFGVYDHPDPEIVPSLSYTDDPFLLDDYPAPDYVEELIHTAALQRDWDAGKSCLYNTVIRSTLRRKRKVKL
jgi:hypothetical protein